ncbi:hypothetical protein ACFO1B_20870 [Dactylosporangium siamense]|uniref:hypothetical protein n=1 Tax=Dactylosporangium siamense TaxID=685454 RepID=UPI001945A64A|nr:hypothetical protein [Dactylosporangium siamense]
MSRSQGEPVRPTKRCLDDLSISFPPLEQPLHVIDHPVAVRAQHVPLEVAAQGAQRVVSITDRVWFKVKTSQHRAAVHRLDPVHEHNAVISAGSAWWWIGAAGTRKADSGNDDFYAQLEAECGRAGKGTGRVSSLHLLPRDVDVKRLKAELATQVVVGIRDIVCRMVANSIRAGSTWSARLQRHEISVLVRARDGEAYIAVVAESFIDPNFLAVVLRAVPGVDSADWLEEPGGAMGIQPGFGQIVRSAIIPTEYQAKIVEQYGVGTER